jgi:sarcosine oxidase subunit alpha
MTSRRLDAGGLVDRGLVVPFEFAGRAYEGFEGDTLASALLANGVVGGFRSPLQGRPRGIFSAGDEEPNAFVEVSAPRFEPIVAATMVNLVDHLAATPRPGVGVLPKDPPEMRPVPHRHAHVETLVIGGGSAGVAAAAAAAAGRVLLIERRALWPAPPELVDAGVTCLPGSVALGLYDDGYVLIHQRLGREQLWHVRAGRVILATGAHERPIAFAGNDLPGVMLAGAACEYLDRYGVLAGERIVVFSTNHAGHDAAMTLAAAGAHVTIVDPGPGGPATDRAHDAGIDVHTDALVTRAQGDGRIEAITIRLADGDTTTLEADLLAVSGGWNPNAGLARAIGAGLAYDEARACFVPTDDLPPWLEIVGAAAGDVPQSVPLWVVPDGPNHEKYVELQRDQTVADVAEAVDAGLRSVEHVKRATYIGTAIDQGRTSGAVTAEITNSLLGWSPGAQGPTNARPPYLPVGFAVLAGLETGPTLMDPIRTTPIHSWHVERGAVMEPVGQWHRPRYFPRDGESMDDAVARECRAVRENAGLLDASTLGKIEVVGPDAPLFLDRMYTNRMSNLAVGSIRYGLMLGLDGMVFDDGVAMRLAEDRYLVTTTTGGAAAVLDRFEEWLQTEWPELRVYCTSVTEQWAVVAVGGPQARAILGATRTDIELTNEGFPFMTFREGTVADVPARVCRVSFTGELSYEIHVAAWHGLHVWESVMRAGEPFGITPYGTEAMHVLRAEKGYVIVGQETDGTVTPDDLGMSWIVNPGKGDFIGKRSLVRADTSREGRRQLVALLPNDPDVVLPEGTQVVAADADLSTIPVPMLGHVTSSYRSPTLGRGFALAMVAAGRSLVGTGVIAALEEGPIACTVASPVLYDPDGERRDG